jgi:hypothetical protein
LDGFGIDSKLKLAAKILHTEVAASLRANKFGPRFIVKMNALVVHQVIFFIFLRSLLLVVHDTLWVRVNLIKVLFFINLL